MQLNHNDVSREAKPGLFIFVGRWVVLLPISVGFFILLFKFLMLGGVDWYFAAPIGLVPMLLSVLFVLAFVNGRAPSYATDLYLQALWKMKVKMYAAGYLDRPPVIWLESKTNVHPKEF